MRSSSRSLENPSLRSPAPPPPSPALVGPTSGETPVNLRGGRGATFIPNRPFTDTNFWYNVLGGDRCSSSSRGVRTRSAPGVVEICSDEKEDDDCVIPDSDPHSAVAGKGEKEGSAGDGGSDDELQIVAEKGKVACRDFPHSRHLCSNMPFGTTSHEKHCTMCYYFACEAPDPCRTLRHAFRYRNLPASRPEEEISHPVALTVSVPRAYSATRVQSGTSNDHSAQVARLIEPIVNAPNSHPAAGAGRGTSNTQTAQISHPLGLTVTAPRASSATIVQSGTSNGHSTQVTHRVEPTAPRPQPTAGTGRGTSNTPIAQISHPPAPRASSGTRVQSGTSNGHSAQVTRLPDATVSAPRPHPAAGVGRGTSNGHTALITRPIESTFSAARPYSAARTGRGTSNAHTSQITCPVEPTVRATREYPVGRSGSGISNAHTAPVTRSVEQTVSAPRVYPAVRAGSDSSNAHSGQITYPATATPDAPEGTTVYEEEDDDCVILDSDPHSAVAGKGENEGSAGDGGSDDELQIVAEKGKVACRDFPHSRHLCSNMPFGTTSHEKHCTMCYCFVCDAPAPCSYWGKALSVDDHCHATDKETKWKALREAFSAARAYSATRVQTGTSNDHSAQVSRPIERIVNAPSSHLAAGAGRGTSNTPIARFFLPPAPRASSATRVQSGTSNGHSAQVTRLLEPTVSAPRPHPAAGAGRGTSNAHTALITHPVESTVSAARPYSAERTGGGTSNAHTSQITRPVEPTVSAIRGYPAGRSGRGISNAHTAAVNRPVEQTVSAPRLYPAVRVGSDSSNGHSGQITYPATATPDAPEGTTVYVGNLPYHIDNERLKLSFELAGVVLFSKVIYDRETGQSRGFGFVTMSTVQEAERAVRIYHGSEVYGSCLTVNIAAPRGGARVGHQSGSRLRIFVCNLPSQVDHSRLKELFSKHGKVVDARVVYERREGAWCSRGFGFVTMATEEESHDAIRALNKQTLEGQALVVRVATERPQQGQNAASQSRNTHTSGRASPNVARATKRFFVQSTTTHTDPPPHAMSQHHRRRGGRKRRQPPLSRLQNPVEEPASFASPHESPAAGGKILGNIPHRRGTRPGLSSRSSCHRRPEPAAQPALA